MKKILLFDEELPKPGAAAFGVMGLYPKAFEEVQIKCEVATTIKCLQDLLRSKPDEFDFVSLDVMVPDDGRVFSKEQTEGGLMTGVAVFKWIANNIDPLPNIVFLTNVPISLLKRRLELEKLSTYQYWILQKSETPPFDFVDFVTQKFLEINDG